MTSASHVHQVKPYRQWPSGDSLPLAVLRHSPAELSQRYGLIFDEDHDDLDSYRLAAIQLPKLGQVWLMHYRGEPEGETTAFVDAQADFRCALQALIVLLDLSSGEIAWTSPLAEPNSRATMQG